MVLVYAYPPLGRPKTAPSGLGSFMPIAQEVKNFYLSNDPPSQEFVPIKITGIVMDEIGEPKNDGSPASALYRVPIRLSSIPPQPWSDLFIRAWNHPQEFTTSHRPGIARMRQDKVILEGTTIEEVRDTHKKTLKLALDVANREYELLLKRSGDLERAKQFQREEHQQNVRKVAEDLNFDE